MFHSVDYVSDESSLYTASSDAGDDSDSSYCPASYRCRSQSKGLVLGSIVIHPLVLQSVEPHTGTQWPVCNESPESVKPVGSALWNNPAVIPNRVGFVKLSQIGVC